MSDRIARMIADPELGGDLVLIGVVMASILDDGLAEGLTLRNIYLLAYGPKGPMLSPRSDVREPLPRNDGRPDWARSRVGEILSADARTYRVQEAREVSCGAPTPRKARCGRNHAVFGLLTDWSTGERHRIAACSKHQDWWREQNRLNDEQRPEVGAVMPFANSGGILARHFPELDWPALWKQLDERWEKHPERESVEPACPTLSVVVDEPDPSKKSPRPNARQARLSRMYLVPSR